MSRTAAGEQWGVGVSLRGRNPRTLFLGLSIFVLTFGLQDVFHHSAFAQEAQGLDTIIESMSVENQELREVITLLATYGEISINVDGDVPPKFPVTINVPKPKTLRQILEDLSSQYGLWIDYQEGNTFVRPGEKKPKEEEVILEKDFPLNFSRPSEVIDYVSNFLSDRPQADAIALDTLGVIRIRDIPEAIARIEELLSRIDVPQQSTVFRILYGDPELIADIIRERLPDLEEGAMTVDLTNSQIIVRTTLDKLAEIQLLIETLDIKKEMRVFHIGFHPVDDVIGVLEDLNLLSEEATIAANEFTGKLIIQDTTERLDRIAEAIHAYDQPRPMVFFEAEIMDVNADYEFNWNPTLTLNDAAVGASATGSENLADGDTIWRLAGSGAFEFAHLDAGKYLAQLQANETDTDVHTIASPRILVEMQEDARLNVGSEEPYGVQSYSGGYYGNTGSSYYSQRVREVGVRLLIYVRNISDRGYVEFEVGLENSALGGRIEIGGDGTTGLRVLTTNVETVAMVKDGRTLAIGGLLQRNEEENNGGVPFLNKVPGVRYLFSTLKRSDKRRKLLLFVTPHILNIDTPFEKYMEDDDALLALHEGKGDLSVADAGVPDTLDEKWSVSGEPQWINRGGRWGFFDADGRFVDKTELYLSAYGDGSETADREGFEEAFEEPIDETTGPSASELLKQLEELPSNGAVKVKQASEASVNAAIPRPIPPKTKAELPQPEAKESADLKPAPQPSPPKRETETDAKEAPPETAAEEPQPKPAAPKPSPEEAVDAPSKPAAPEVKKPPSVKPPAPKIGNEALEALNQPADGLGQVKGTLGDLLNSIRAQTSVMFLREGIPMNAPVDVNGQGKTFGQVLKEVLDPLGMKYSGLPQQLPRIVEKQPSGPKKAPRSVPAPEDNPPQSRVDPFSMDPWGNDTTTEPVRTDRTSVQRGSLTANEMQALSARRMEPKTVSVAPVTPPALEPWEVPLEVDGLAEASDSGNLPKPRGLRPAATSTVKDEVWDNLLDGDVKTLAPLEDPPASPFSLTRHVSTYENNQKRTPSTAPLSEYRAETVAMTEPSETPKADQKKNRVWGKVKGFFKKDK